MATRSLIGKLNPDNTFTYIYCHWDGYPRSVGNKLVDNYFTNDRVNALLELGDLSVLGEKIGGKQNFNDLESHMPQWCLAYGRDRGDKNCDAKIIKLEELKTIDHGQDYIYIWGGNMWKCYTPSIDEVIIPNNNININQR